MDDDIDRADERPIHSQRRYSGARALLCAAKTRHDDAIISDTEEAVRLLAEHESRSNDSSSQSSVVVVTDHQRIQGPRTQVQEVNNRSQDLTISSPPRLRSSGRVVAQTPTRATKSTMRGRKNRQSAEVLNSPSNVISASRSSGPSRRPDQELSTVPKSRQHRKRRYEETTHESNHHNEDFGSFALLNGRRSDAEASIINNNNNNADPDLDSIRGRHHAFNNHESEGETEEDVARDGYQIPSVSLPGLPTRVAKRRRTLTAAASSADQFQIVGDGTSIGETINSAADSKSTHPDSSPLAPVSSGSAPLTLAVTVKPLSRDTLSSTPVTSNANKMVGYLYAQQSTLSLSRSSSPSSHSSIPSSSSSSAYAGTRSYAPRNHTSEMGLQMGMNLSIPISNMRSRTMSNSPSASGSDEYHNPRVLTRPGRGPSAVAAHSYYPHSPESATHAHAHEATGMQYSYPLKSVAYAHSHSHSSRAYTPEPQHSVRSPSTKSAPRISAARQAAEMGVSVGSGGGGRRRSEYERDAGYASEDLTDEPGDDDGSDYDDDLDAHDLLMRSAGGENSSSGRRIAAAPGGEYEYSSGGGGGGSSSGRGPHRGLGASSGQSGRISPSQGYNPYPSSSTRGAVAPAAGSSSGSGGYNTRRSTQPHASSSLSQTQSQPQGRVGGPGTGTKRRGNLPKEVTEVLKSWILSHAENPYPSDDEKKTLCTQTGLSYVQVSNWMINARRRVLPPENKHKYQRPSAAASGLQTLSAAALASGQGGASSSSSSQYPAASSSSSQQVTLPPLSELLSRDDDAISGGSGSASAMVTESRVRSSSRSGATTAPGALVYASYSRPDSPLGSSSHHYHQGAASPSSSSVRSPRSSHHRAAVASPRSYDYDDRQQQQQQRRRDRDRGEERDRFVLPNLNPNPPVPSSSSASASSSSRSRILTVQELTQYSYTDAQAEYARQLALERGGFAHQQQQQQQQPRGRGSGANSPASRWDDPDRRAAGPSSGSGGSGR